MKSDNPKLTKAEICRTIGVSPFTLNNALRNSGNGDMVKKHTIHIKSKKESPAPAKETVVKKLKPIKGGQIESKMSITEDEVSALILDR